MYDKTIKLSDKLTCGYQTFCDKTHPLAFSSGWLYYHRHVASIKLGHWLTPEEHVHHIDGNKLNNDPDNLEVLSQSEHCRLHWPTQVYKKQCKQCGKITDRTGIKEKKRNYCSDECLQEYKNERRIKKNKPRPPKIWPTKIIWPTPEEIQKLVWEMPTIHLAKQLGVSDNAIYKFCKKNGLNKPPRGYWEKLKYNKL